VAFYSQSAQEALEPRVQQLFTALTEIETDHIHIAEEFK